MSDKDFGDEMIEQVLREHRLLVDAAETVEIFLDDEDGSTGDMLKTVKLVYVGKHDTPSYWDPETYEECFGVQVDKAI